jgi:hypothetical protein
MGPMSVREDCRHYLGRTTASGEVVQRCRVGVNEESPFACPEECLFFEGRSVSDAGWTQGSTTPMTNTADGLAGLPRTSKRRRKRH